MSSLKQRQKFLELKFMGNRRLAEEFFYLQDPNVRKLEKWQKWKQQVVPLRNRLHSLYTSF